MSDTFDTFNNIASAIQLALTPVVLLSGIVAMLNVMAGRLSRIIDRGRKLTADRTGPKTDNHKVLTVLVTPSGAKLTFQVAIRPL